MIKNILFDMDGVLINTEPLHYRIWKQVMNENGIDLDYEHYKDCIGSTRAFLYDLIKKGYGVDFHGNDTVGKRFHEIKDDIIKAEGVPRIDGVIAVIHYLHDKGYHMAVASSSAQNYIEAHMKELGLTDCFEVLFSAEKVKNPKPAPDVFLAAAEKLNANPKECLVIEDSYNGSRAAKAAGMLCYGFKNPDSGNQDLSFTDKVFYPFINLKKML